MPTMKNRTQGGGKTAAPMTLMNAMDLPGKATHGPPHNSKDYVFKNIMGGGNAKHTGKAPKNITGSYDTKTRLALPASKTSGKRSRTQKGMKAK